MSSTALPRNLTDAFRITRTDDPLAIMFAVELLSVCIVSPENRVIVLRLALPFTCTFPLACNTPAGVLGPSAPRVTQENESTRLVFTIWRRQKVFTWGLLSWTE